MIVLVTLLSYHIWWFGVRLPLLLHDNNFLALAGIYSILDVAAFVSTLLLCLKNTTLRLTWMTADALGYLAVVWASTLLITGCVEQTIIGDQVVRQALLTDVIATCLGFSAVKSHLVWVPPVLGYAALFIVCLPRYGFNGELLFLSVTLAALIIFAVMGKYKHEKHDREKWLAQKLVREQSDRLGTQHDSIVAMLGNFCDCLLNVGPDSGGWQG